MVQESDLVREEINETREQLTEKLVTLEERIREQVETAKHAADETIDNVKEVVRRFNPKVHIEEHPYAALGLSVGVGTLVGVWVAGRRSHSSSPSYPSYYRPTGFVPQPAPVSAPQSARPIAASFVTPSASGPSVWKKLGDYFEEEIGLVKGMALAGLAEGAAQLLKNSAPHLTEKIDEVVDSVKRKVDPQHATGERRESA